MRPEIENATEVMPQRILSCVKVFNSRSARISKRRQEASSEPVAKASPLGKNLWTTEISRFENRNHERNAYETALMSDSWPVKVCVARPVRISHSLAVASHAPEMKTLLLLGASDKLKGQIKIRKFYTEKKAKPTS